MFYKIIGNESKVNTKYHTFITIYYEKVFCIKIIIQLKALHSELLSS